MRCTVHRSNLVALTLVPVAGLFLGGCERPEGGGRGADAEPPAPAASLPTADESEVTRLAADFMQALSERDVGRLDGLLAPQAALYSIREGENGPVYGIRSRAEFLDGLAADGPAFLERIWEPTVEVTGRIAMVWAPYDFYSDGTFSHCGIDILAFLKLEEGWRITSVTYNVVRDGCPASPLGAPGG